MQFDDFISHLLFLSVLIVCIFGHSFVAVEGWNGRRGLAASVDRNRVDAPIRHPIVFEVDDDIVDDIPGLVGCVGACD